MAVQHPHRFLPTFGLTRRLSARQDGSGAIAHQTVMTSAAAKSVATARILLGFVFLWAFLDKTFGWSYSTPAAGAWVHGGSPTKGFLSHVAAGPMESPFHHWAGQGWADWLFMLGLLGIGLALVSGIAMRIAATTGTALLALMWAAEWPPARHLSNGTLSMSSNPFADSHLIYAVLLIALAALHAGDTWGLGRLWSRLPLVGAHSWLR